MLRVTEWQLNAGCLRFAIDQIEKYNPGVSVIRNLGNWFAVYRTDMITPKVALKEQAELNQMENKGE